MHPAGCATKSWSVIGIAKRIKLVPWETWPSCSQPYSGRFLSIHSPLVAVRHRLRLRLPVRSWYADVWRRPYEVPPPAASLTSIPLQRRFHSVKESHGLAKFLTVSLEV
jgi:hypothetical protein